MAEREDDHYRVLLDYDPFRTETQAFGSMHHTAAVQDPNSPSQRLQECRPEWEGRRITTVKGARILSHPHIYRIGTQANADAVLDNWVNAALDDWVEALE